MVIPLVVQGPTLFRGEFDLGSHICHHTKPHEYVKQKPQLAPVSSLAWRALLTHFYHLYA
jgi:hypothetical protein